MNRTKRTIITAVAAVAATAALTAAIAGAASVRARGAGELRDLQVDTEQPFDHATAQVVAVENGDGSTTVTLKVQGIDHAAAGQTFGAHVHVGGCALGDPDGTQGHWREAGKAASAESEVWLDFTVRPNGTAGRTTTINYDVPAGAAHSVVIHALGTAPSGAAGTKWACLPVEF